MGDRSRSASALSDRPPPRRTADGWRRGHQPEL